jgi:hypothetical protein
MSIKKLKTGGEAKSRQKSRVGFLLRHGPGLITGAADYDTSGIATN